jgi:hypothetical protein
MRSRRVRLARTLVFLNAAARRGARPCRPEDEEAVAVQPYLRSPGEQRKEEQGCGNGPGQPHGRELPGRPAWPGGWPVSGWPGGRLYRWPGRWPGGGLGSWLNRWLNRWPRVRRGRWFYCRPGRDSEVLGDVPGYPAQVSRHRHHGGPQLSGLKLSRCAYRGGLLLHLRGFSFSRCAYGGGLGVSIGEDPARQPDGVGIPRFRCLPPYPVGKAGRLTPRELEYFLGAGNGTGRRPPGAGRNSGRQHPDPVVTQGDVTLCPGRRGRRR